MWKLIDKLNRTGIRPEWRPGTQAVVQMTNGFTILTALAFLTLYPFVYFYFDHWLPGFAVLLASANFILPLGFNALGKFNFSRLYYSVTLPLVFLSGSIIKLSIIDINTGVYWYVYRIPLVAMAIIPFTLFMRKEREKWLPVILLNIHILLFYNQLVCWSLGISMQESSALLDAPYFDFVAVLSYVVLCIISFMVRGYFEQYAREKKHLIEHIEAARETISKQKEALAKANIELLDELKSKNTDLELTHKELLQRQNELLQFSYSVSHNLRGPVAGMIGLSQLVNKDDLSQENAEIFNHIGDLCHTLDTTISDLNHVINVRHSVSEIKQPVSINEELDKVLTLLNAHPDGQSFILERQIEKDLLFTVKAALHSALYNLMSNAIKYRRPEVPLVITVNSRIENDQPVIMVSDNGMGLNMQTVGKKLFGIYQRFHTSIEGKGMGLFLVRMQIEMLGGHIDVDGKPGAGCSFTITLPTTSLLQGDKLIESDLIKAFYLSDLNALVFQWKRGLSVDEFAEVYSIFHDISEKFPIKIFISELQESLFTLADRNAIRHRFAERMNGMGMTHYLTVIPPLLRDSFDEAEYRKSFGEVYRMELGIFDSLAACITFARQISARTELRTP